MAPAPSGTFATFWPRPSCFKGRIVRGTQFRAVDRAAGPEDCPSQSGSPDRIEAISPTQDTRLMRTILAVTAVLCVLGSSAEAHGRHHHHHHHYIHHHHHLRHHHYIHRGEAADIFSMPGAFTMPGSRAPGADGTCAPGRRRSRTVVQSRALMGALRVQRGRSAGRRDRRVASSCRKNCRPRKWPVDRAERQ